MKKVKNVDKDKALLRPRGQECPRYGGMVSVGADLGVGPRLINPDAPMGAPLRISCGTKCRNKKIKTKKRDELISA